MAEIKPPTLYERALRKFSLITQLATMVPFYSLCILCLALALTPAIKTFIYLSELSSGLEGGVRLLALGASGATSYLVYGLSIILVIPFVNFVLRLKLETWRGQYMSGPAIKWYFHNGLTYIVRYTFLELITPTPLNNMFFTLMGMKIGRGVHINSSHISDPCLITIGDKATIGGSATIVAHYGQGGYLVLAPVTIGKGATVGLRAIIMGGAEIGEGAKILPNSVVLPKMKIPAGEVWGGIPAQKVDIKKIDMGVA